MAASSHTGGSPAADGPPMLPAEFDLLDAMDRLSSAHSDAEFNDAVAARDRALRRLLIAISDLPVITHELVVTRATQALARERRSTPRSLPAVDGQAPP